MDSFQFTRIKEGEPIKSSALRDVFSQWKKNKRWLFIAPHDDDLCLGAGLLMQSAQADGIPIRCVITTDGSMGYGATVSKEKICETRKDETNQSFKILGIDDIQWLNFPDCSLNFYSGAREAKTGDPCIIGGSTGIQNAYTYQLRDFRPTRVFVPAGSDLHPDHKIVYQEILISLFHCAGDIWPQLGSPLKAAPSIYEMAIYCDFPAPPNIQVIAGEKAFETKLESIAAYQSQQQIEALVNNIRKAGSVEYFREVMFNLYHPETYKHLF